ncbi:hypothetical protein EC841_103408 [Raoultella ornithinolytica]|uniref:Uncharacterized protein n=1 Tax=Raoultella ornithinolytica TaxID=54291 RepID=A0ABD7QK39_RAOOR|nr:hypothetical protein EC841_103408 [Raoultella ornithinolytica]
MSLNVFYRTFIAAKMSAEGRDFGPIRRLLVPERRLSNALKPAEAAGVVGLKIAETLPAGRGSPHGCGLRAVIYKDVSSARPDSLTASVEGTAQRRFWLAGARGYRGRRRWAAPCALPALWGTWGRETAGERNILRSKKISSAAATAKPHVTTMGCNILRSKKISSAAATTKPHVTTMGCNILRSKKISAAAATAKPQRARPAPP